MEIIAPHIIKRIRRNNDIAESYKIYGGNMPNDEIKRLSQKHKSNPSLIRREILSLGLPKGTYLSLNQKLRTSIIERDKVCQYCGKKPEVVDHVYPRCGGGHNMDYNLVAACKKCNDTKSAKIWIPNNFEILKSINPEYSEFILKEYEANKTNECNSIR